jgi:hypothetical protein
VVEDDPLRFLALARPERRVEDEEPEQTDRVAGAWATPATKFMKKICPKNGEKIGKLGNILFVRLGYCLQTVSSTICHINPRHDCLQFGLSTT